MVVFVPVDYEAAKLPFLTISTVYAVFLKYQHIVMLTFVNTLMRFSKVCYLFLLSMSPLYAVFLKYQHIVMLKYVRQSNV